MWWFKQGKKGFSHSFYGGFMADVCSLSWFLCVSPTSMVCEIEMNCSPLILKVCEWIGSFLGIEGSIFWWIYLNPMGYNPVLSDHWAMSLQGLRPWNESGLMHKKRAVVVGWVNLQNQFYEVVWKQGTHSSLCRLYFDSTLNAAILGCALSLDNTMVLVFCQFGLLVVQRGRSRKSTSNTPMGQRRRRWMFGQKFGNYRQFWMSTRSWFVVFSRMD